MPTPVDYETPRQSKEAKVPLPVFVVKVWAFAVAITAGIFLMGVIVYVVKLLITSRH